MGFLLVIIALIGGLIGVYAAQQKGFSQAGGFICGALLGPLSFLLFAADGTKKPCPMCREQIHKDAVVCPKCRSPLSQGVVSQ